MSQAVGGGLRVERVNEPRVEINNERVWLAQIGGASITQQRYAATSFNDSFFNWTVVPPSKSVILDRVVIMHAHAVFTFAGTNSNGNNLLQDGRDAPRAHALARAISNLSVALNGTTTSIELQQVIGAMERVRSPLQWNRTFGSISPQMTDTYALYPDGVGAVNNPLGKYGDNEAQVARGGYYMNIASNTTTAASVGVDFYEFLELPPFLFSSDNDGKLREAGGLCWLDTFIVTAAMNQSLARMWSHAGGAGSQPSDSTISSLSVHFDTSPELLINWITPRVEMNIMPAINYPYSSIVRYTNTETSIAPGVTTTIPSNVIQFATVPEYIYLFARRSDNDILSTLAKTINSTDTFGTISKITIQWNNVAGILSQATPQHLYQISLQNGLTDSWEQFSGLTSNFITTGSPSSKKIGTSGSLLALCPVKDFGMQGLSDGSLGQFNFQVNIDIFNQNQSDTIPFTLYIVAVYDGILHLSQSSAITQLGVASREDIATAPESSMSYNELQSVYGGGSFFSTLGNIFSKVNSFLRDNKVVSTGLSLIPHPGAQIGSKVASILGYGDGGGIMAAGELIGGRKLTKKQMRKRLMM